MLDFSEKFCRVGTHNSYYEGQAVDTEEAHHLRDEVRQHIRDAEFVLKRLTYDTGRIIDGSWHVPMRPAKLVLPTATAPALHQVHHRPPRSPVGAGESDGPVGKSNDGSEGLTPQPSTTSPDSSATPRSTGTPPPPTRPGAAPPPRQASTDASPPTTRCAPCPMGKACSSMAQEPRYACGSGPGSPTPISSSAFRGPSRSLGLETMEWPAGQGEEVRTWSRSLMKVVSIPRPTGAVHGDVSPSR